VIPIATYEIPLLHIPQVLLEHLGGGTLSEMSPATEGLDLILLESSRFLFHLGKIQFGDFVADAAKLDDVAKFEAVVIALCFGFIEVLFVAEGVTAEVWVPGLGIQSVFLG
jgi:hypothetical protein